LNIIDYGLFLLAKSHQFPLILSGISVTNQPYRLSKVDFEKGGGRF